MKNRVIVLSVPFQYAVVCPKLRHRLSRHTPEPCVKAGILLRQERSSFLIGQDNVLHRFVLVLQILELVVDIRGEEDLCCGG